MPLPLPARITTDAQAFDCLCGAHIEADDVHELTAEFQGHLASAHPGFRTDPLTAQLIVLDNSYDA